MQFLKNKLQLVFILFGAFLFAQVLWWTYLLIQDKPHRKIVMIVSESSFFLFLMVSGLYLLYRSIKNEKRAFELQKQFIQTVSHESRTPLTSLKLRLEAADNLSEKNLYLDEVNRIIRALEKSTELFRIETQKYVLESYYLKDLISNLLERLSPWLQKEGVQANVLIASDICVVVDYVAFQNSLQAILENAVIYNGQKNKTIQIIAEETHSKLLLKIEDNGLGISAEDLPYLFNKFYRGKSSSQKPGTGVGLYLAKKIIDLHHGVIKVSSELKKGSVFQIEMKCSKEAYVG
jgi:signal transduction histidine kinase